MLLKPAESISTAVYKKNSIIDEPSLWPMQLHNDKDSTTDRICSRITETCVAADPNFSTIFTQKF